jgi:zinc protease
MKNVLNLTFLGLFLASCAGTSVKNEPKASAIVESTLKTVLDNGLTVVIVPNHKLPIVAYYTLFDVGGRYETKGTTGATHFLEHMMFKGAKKYGPGEFDRFIDKNGGSNNAYTTFDHTVYHEVIPSSALDQLIDIESDRFANLALENESFESERKVIFEERKMRYENSPDGMLYLTMMKKIFEKTPYGQSVIGDEEDLKVLTRDHVMDFFKTFYTPDNSIIVIAGDVNPKITLEKIKEKYGAIPRSKTLAKLKSERDDQKNYQFVGELNKEYKLVGTNQNPKFMLAFRGDKSGLRRDFVIDLMSSMLSNGGSSYLIQKYVENEKPVLQDINLSNQNMKNSGVITFSGEIIDGGNLEQFKENFFKDLPSFCTEGLNERALQKAKNQILASGYEHLKTNDGMASHYVSNEAVYHDYNYGKKELEIYLSVKLNEVVEVCHELMKPEKGIFLSIWSKNNKMSESK